MADDEHREFAWPSTDADAEPSGGSDVSGAEEATTELPVRDAPNNYVSADQPTVWVTAPRPEPAARPRQAPPPEPAPRQTGAAQQPIAPASTHAAPQRIEPDGQTHAAGTAGESEQATQEEPPATGVGEHRRRRRWPLVTAALLVLIAIGVVLALPPVSNRLALPWAPNAPKAAPPEPVRISRTLHGPQPATGHRPTAEGVAAALQAPASNPALGTLTGAVVDPATGQTLWARNAAAPRTPASTTKLLTSAAALLALDHDMRIPTTVVKGREPGTVVLVAGGDPTLSSLPKGKKSIYPGAAHLDQLVAEVKRATGGNVDKVAIDLSAYSGPTSAESWDPVDVPTYTAAIVPAMLDGGHTDPTDSHSAWVENPAGVLLDEFAARLGAEVAAQSTVTAPRNAKVLGRVYSARLPQLVRSTLLLSDDVLAGAIARQVAMQKGMEPSFEGAGKAVQQVLAAHGFGVSGVHLSDGSGMSPENKVPAKLLADILAVAAAPTPQDPRTAKLRPLLTGLPVAGGTGTLSGRYTEQPAAAGRGWVRAKTGTLSGVNTLAGIVLDSQGRVLVFAFMSSDSNAAAARPALDALAAALRGCGCNSG